MPPKIRSRYFPATILTDDQGRRFVGRRKPLVIPEEPGDRFIEIGPGETLFHFTERTLGDALIFHIIADANDIVDPTIEIAPGTVLRVPVRAERFIR